MRKFELKKGIYVLPSLFTCGNMAFGFLSMVVSMHTPPANFTIAAWLIVAAIGCDMLDGRVARLTHTTSEFGVQLDSLSDLVSFGIAPAVLMYKMLLETHPLTHGKLGVAIAVLFVLCSGLRLAKFNVQAANGVVHKTFMGLPTPAAAGVIISFVLSYELYAPADVLLSAPRFTTRSIRPLMNAMPTFMMIMPIVMVVLSFLMVSNVPYQSFKKLKLSRPVALRLLFLCIILALLIIVYPQNIFFIIFSVYALSGLVLYIPHLVHAKKRHIYDEIGDDEERDEEEQWK
jgi:CDP-diacylglycerol--serine O-phosphatidyltransferase